MTDKSKLPHRLDLLKSLATKKSKENKLFLKDIASKQQASVFRETVRLHDEVFAETDCLACANCCKTTSPVFKQRDISRLARALRMKEQVLIENYLYLDDESDYVLQSTPCPFLLDDNHCMVYDDRPDACRNYPHTDKKPIRKIKGITYENTFVCPAVFEIVERLKKI